MNFDEFWEDIDIQTRAGIFSKFYSSFKSACTCKSYTTKEAVVTGFLVYISQNLVASSKKILNQKWLKKLGFLFIFIFWFHVKEIWNRTIPGLANLAAQQVSWFLVG